ncbi:hypothetical protein JW960_12650 [candidate division KSB1 bacterium]|nr:hypothetical protein [candidate division KSB1 bacterium]
MDVKLDSLIEKIKKEGIEEAQSSADEIVKEARKKATKIVEDAKKEAEKVVDDGKRKVDQFKATAEADLQQAARNAELLLKEKFTALFDAVFKREVGEKLSADFMKDVILKIVDSWAKDANAEVVLNDKDKKALETVLFKGVKEDAKKGVTLKVSPDVANGFRIGVKGSDVYYDFSDDAIAAVLKSLINPNLKAILDK